MNKVKALRAVLSVLFIILGVLAVVVARSLYMQTTVNPHLSCLYLNATVNTNATVSIMGIGNQTVVVVLDNTYATAIAVNGITPTPIGFEVPAHSLVTVYSTTCNPLVQVYLVFPNNTVVYGQPRPIDGQ